MRLAGWLLIGQGVVFAIAMIVAIGELTRVPTVPVEGWVSAADVDRFRAVMTSVERDRIVLFILLAAGFVVVGCFMLRRLGIEPRYALFGLNVLLVGAWAYTVWRSIDRLDERDMVYGMVGSSGLGTGLGYAGLSGGLVLLLVDIVALTNPSDLVQVDLD
jgi:hypothetical protein